MRVLFEAQYYNKNWNGIVFAMIFLIIFAIFSKKIAVGYEKFSDEITDIFSSTKKDKKLTSKDYTVILRVISLTVIAVFLCAYIRFFIPVMKYKTGNDYEHVTGTVTQFQKNGNNESFFVGNIFFEVYYDDLQLTYTGGIIQEGMQVNIEYYNDSLINRIFKITIHKP